MVDSFLEKGKTMEQTQNGGNKIRRMLPIPIIRMRLSACTVENDPVHEKECKPFAGA